MSQEAEYTKNKILDLARKYAKGKECPKCHHADKKWRVTPLYEFGDPEMPSQIVLLCDHCKIYNETVAQMPDEQARAYAKSVMEDKEKGFRRATPEEAEKIIKLK
jgi:phage FluMu protein Com